MAHIMEMTGAAAEVIIVVVVLIIIIIINVQLHCCTLLSGEHCENIVKCVIHINVADERFGFNMFVSTYSIGGWKSFAIYTLHTHIYLH